MSGSPPTEQVKCQDSDYRDDPRMVRLLSLSFPPDFEVLQARNGQGIHRNSEAKARTSCCWT